MTTNLPFPASGIVNAGGVGRGWVWMVQVQVPSGVSTQTFTVAVDGTTVATLTGAQKYGPIALVGTSTLTISGGQTGQDVQLTGNVFAYSPGPPLPPMQGGLVFNVLDYGADPTGVQDSTAAITQCCKDAAAVGAVAYAGPGTFISNGATSPVQDTGYLQLQGAGENLTKFICTQTPPGGGGVFNLAMPGEIADITFDGNGTVVGTSSYQVLSVGNGHAGVTWPGSTLRRVTCTNINPGVTNNGWNLIVWMSGTGSPIIDTLILEDVTVSGPSATSFDAMAINTFNVCYATRMNFLNLVRTPNFYSGNTLIVAGLYSNGCTSVGGVIVNSAVLELLASGIKTDATFGNAGFNLAAPKSMIVDSDFAGGLTLNGTNATQQFTNCRMSVSNGFFIRTAVSLLEVSTCVFDSSIFVYGPTASGPYHFSNCAFSAGGGGAVFVSNSSAVIDAHIEGGSIPSGATLLSGCTLASTARISGLSYYNPVGPVTVAVPASGTATAALPYDATFYITQATAASSVAVQGQTLAIPIGGPTAVRVPAGETLTPTYTTAPTWVVMGE